MAAAAPVPSPPDHPAPVPSTEPPDRVPPVAWRPLSALVGVQVVALCSADAGELIRAVPQRRRTSRRRSGPEP